MYSSFYLIRKILRQYFQHLTKYKNHQQLLVLAVPMILSNITVPLLGLVDTAVIGHLPYSYYLGGSTVGAMIITFITWLCGFLRMSTTGLTAQSFGAGDQQQASLVLFRGLLVAILLGLVIILGQSVYLDFALYLAGGSEQVQFYAKQYAVIRIWGLPAALANLVLLGWLLGHHKAKVVLVILLITNSLNLILDIVFVIGFDLKVEGIAYATLIAEYTGFLLALAMSFKVKPELFQSLQNIKLLGKKVMDSVALLAYFKLNRDILIRTLCLELCFVFITFQGTRLGDDIVAANAILMNFLLLISFGLDGIANAVEVLVGQAKGEKSKSKLISAVYLGLIWSLLFALFYSLAFWLFGDQILHLMTNISSLFDVTKLYLPWLVILPLLACWCYLYDGVYIGLMETKVMRDSMLIATFLGFFPLWLILQGMGNHGLWAAFCLFMLARGGTLGWHFHIIVKNKALV